MLDILSKEENIKIRGLSKNWKCYSQNESVILVDHNKGEKVEEFNFLRQQVKKSKLKEIYYSLSDFISPNLNSEDVIGAFVITAGQEIEDFASKFEMRPDDIIFVATQPLSLYSRTLTQILGTAGLTLQARDTIRAEVE